MRKMRSVTGAAALAVASAGMMLAAPASPRPIPATARSRTRVRTTSPACVPPAPGTSGSTWCSTPLTRETGRCLSWATGRLRGSPPPSRTRRGPSPMSGSNTATRDSGCVTSGTPVGTTAALISRPGPSPRRSRPGHVPPDRRGRRFSRVGSTKRQREFDVRPGSPAAWGPGPTRRAHPRTDGDGAPRPRRTGPRPRLRPGFRLAHRPGVCGRTNASWCAGSVRRVRSGNPAAISAARSPGTGRHHSTGPSLSPLTSPW